MKIKICTVFFILLFAAAPFLAAQTPAVIVEYFENTSGEMYVRTADGADYDVAQFNFGEELPVGATLITLDGDYAELRMEPNGSIIRLGENTNFKVEGLQGRGEAKRNIFHVAVGKFKAVLAKREGARYAFRGMTAAMGIRGTIVYGYNVPGESELALVEEGSAEFENAAGTVIQLGAGQAADALAETFAPFDPPADLLQIVQRNMDFQRLKIEDVPGYGRVAADGAGEEEEQQGEEEKGADRGAGAGDQITEKQGERGGKTEPKTPEWLEKMMEIMGVELGTKTIDNDTWARVVFQPKFAIGKLKMALYLPIIYKDDLFDPTDWYMPEGESEWNFGYGRKDEGWDVVALDALNDLFLKIRYIEYGDNRDPFFFKFGNLSNFQIGHGSIMRMYANDRNFPAERKLGLNLGLNEEKSSLEVIVDNAADPEVFGLRSSTRPFAPGMKLGIGLTALADINPERLALGEAATNGNPIFINIGLDVDQPLIEKEAVSLVLFADVASMVPYFREDVSSVTAGFQPDAFWYDGKPRNWGLDAGIFGNLAMLDYRVEFLWSHGIYKPFFYGPMYDIESPVYVTELVSYLDDPSLPKWDTQRMGLAGEIGYTMDKVFYISGGYEWAWPINSSSGSEWPEDMIWLELGIFEELLPLYGSVALTKKDFASGWINDDFDFFDENLILSGEIAYPVSPIMELALIFQSFVFNGDWSPSVSVLMRLN